MKTIYQNTFSVHLMIWETDHRKRNKNNEVKLVIDDEDDIKVGDLIIGNYAKGHTSRYEVLEIKERRKSLLSNKDYVTIITSWSSKIPLFTDYKLKTNYTFNKFFNIK